MSDLSDSEEYIKMRSELMGDLESDDEIIEEKKDKGKGRAEEEEIKITKTETKVDHDARTGFRLRKRIANGGPWELNLAEYRYVPIPKVQDQIAEFNSIQVGIKPSKNWFTTGVVDKFTINNNDFCVTQLSDMCGSDVFVYITGKAFQKFKNAIGMGSIITVKKPFILNPSEVHTPSALHVDQVQQMWVIGQSLDLVQCQAFVKADKQCEEWTDGRSGEYCRSHLTMVYNKSKNGRMELASGNTGLDIRWASMKRSQNGSVRYESKDKQLADSLLKRRKLKTAYYINGKGLVTIEGKVIERKTPIKKVESDAEKSSLMEFLKGRHDAGAEMIRQLKGIKEERPRTVLSNEALNKMGIGRNTLTEEEEAAKKRSIDVLQASTNQKVNKKPRYVDI